MAEIYNPVNIGEVITQRLYPTIMMWNRLEGRPRTHHFDRALKAEVRDALWMLTKQWQMGEFRGDDAGSPVTAKVHITTSHLNKYQAAGNPVQPFNDRVPLETSAEQKKIPFERSGNKISIDIRLQLGKYWMKLLKKEGLPFEDQYLLLYPFELPEKERETGFVFAHPGTWQQMASISGRCMDGYTLLSKIMKGHPASEGSGASGTDENKLNKLGELLRDYYMRAFYQPLDETNNAWLPDRLEYSFSCTADSDSDQKVLAAEQYYHGHLDWFAFNLEKKKETNPLVPKEKFINSFVPSHVVFEGMPDNRWWKFEDSKTSFGDVKPSTSEVAKLLLIEFGLIFSRDWFMIPFPLPVGSLANIQGLTLTNNFGETFWIEAAGKKDTKQGAWSMFKMHSGSSDDTLLLAPAALKVQEGQPQEEILLIRDEMANMVWGIETVVPTATGSGDKGSEAALRIRKYHEEIVQKGFAPAELPYAAAVSYQAMTEVPEHWIPFVPVHMDGHSREIQLQRASMLRIIEGDPVAPVKIKPQTSLMREGLDDAAGAKPYYIHEEEIPRAGIRISQSFQRTRWINGEVFVWLGMKKKTGRGEGSSGLAFDQLINSPAE